MGFYIHRRWTFRGTIPYFAFTGSKEKSEGHDRRLFMGIVHASG
jgi:hypothetical protein